MITVQAPGKVNVFLGVGPRRDDAFHELTTVFQAVSLTEEVTAQAADALRCTVTGEGAADVPAGDDNLAVRAARLLAAQTGREPDVELVLAKSLPVAGGMAGGSADAAATLLACDTLWQTGLGVSGLASLAAELGSDVPFVLQGGTALGTGRGVALTPVLASGRYHWVLAFADRGLSTEAVYTEHDRAGPLPQGDLEAVLLALRAGDAAALGVALHNDLQAAALRLRPQLQRTLDTGLDLGALGAVVSGSGPTCAFLTATWADAVALAASLSGAGVCRAVRTAYGPVQGARVVADWSRASGGAWCGAWASPRGGRGRSRPG